jgi:hypothetical protein
MSSFEEDLKMTNLQILEKKTLRVLKVIQEAPWSSY